MVLQQSWLCPWEQGMELQQSIASSADVASLQSNAHAVKAVASIPNSSKRAIRILKEGYRAVRGSQEAHAVLVSRVSLLPSVFGMAEFRADQEGSLRDFIGGRLRLPSPDQIRKACGRRD